MGNEEIKITKDLKIKIHQPNQLIASSFCIPFEGLWTARRGFRTTASLFLTTNRFEGLQPLEGLQRLILLQYCFPNHFLNCHLLQPVVEDIQSIIGFSRILYRKCIISDNIAKCLAKADLFLILLSTG